MSKQQHSGRKCYRTFGQGEINSEYQLRQDFVEDIWLKYSLEDLGKLRDGGNPPKSQVATKNEICMCYFSLFNFIQLMFELCGFSSSEYFPPFSTWSMERAPNSSPPSSTLKCS